MSAPTAQHGAAATPPWMLSISEFDAIEVHPCCVVGFADGLEIVETCEPEDAHFWSAYGHYRTGGVACLEDFATEAEAKAFADGLRQAYPHLAEEVQP
jgi:hypothetical protein